MDEKMKKFIPLFVLLGLALVAVAIYIIVYHVGMPTRDLSGPQANFWLGLWQGLIVFLSFIASWFDNNIVLYQVHNNGFWYNLGYIIGLIIIGAGSGASRRGSKTKEKAKKQKQEQESPIDDEAKNQGQEGRRRLFLEPNNPGPSLLREPMYCQKGVKWIEEGWRG